MVEKFMKLILFCYQNEINNCGMIMKKMLSDFRSFNKIIWTTMCHNANLINL